MYICLSSGKSLWKLFLEQFDDLLVKILLGAAVVSFVSARHCHTWPTAYMILLVPSFLPHPVACSATLAEQSAVFITWGWRAI